jgi:branched-chain amino acid transport system ATP-binding protein
MTSAIRAEGLSAGYGDLIAIRDVSVDLEESTILGLIGRNGAGKSTTLRALAGLNRAMTGRIYLGGSDVTGLSPARRSRAGISLVPEGKRIFGDRTVMENLVIGGFAFGLSRSRLQAKAEDTFGLFPILREFRSRRAGFLSGGQQQMLAIAQALMSSPKVLLLDEPSAGLAPAVLREVLQAVTRMRDETGLTVVLVEQAPDLALDFADTIAVLDVGRIAMTASAGDRGLRERIHDVYLAGAATKR